MIKVTYDNFTSESYELDDQDIRIGNLDLIEKARDFTPDENAYWAV